MATFKMVVAPSLTPDSYTLPEPLTPSMACCSSLSHPG